jgi:hypothetical protein
MLETIFLDMATITLDDLFYLHVEEQIDMPLFVSNMS